MARRKKLTGDARIEELMGEIKALEDEIAAKKAEIKSIKAQKEEEKKAEVVAAVMASNKSMDEILSFLNN